jgi:hypothetical protein
VEGGHSRRAEGSVKAPQFPVARRVEAATVAGGGRLWRLGSPSFLLCRRHYSRVNIAAAPVIVEAPIGASSAPGGDACSSENTGDARGEMAWVLEAWRRTTHPRHAAAQCWTQRARAWRKCVMVVVCEQRRGEKRRDVQVGAKLGGEGA